MLQIKKIGLILIILFFVGPAFSQDDFEILDEEENTIEEVVCIPQSLAVPFDIYAGKITDARELSQLYSFGSEYFKNKNYKEALPYLWKVFVNNSKNSSRAIGKIAESYFKEKKIDSTLIACYKGLEKFPTNQKLHYYAGFLQKELGKSSCAIPHYEAMVAKNPKSIAYLSTLAFLYSKSQKYEKAIETQQKVIDLDPSNAKAQDTIARYIAASGESPLAAWEKAWNQDNTNFKAGRNFAKYAIEEGEYEKAKAPLDVIIAKEPKISDYKLRASACENLGQYNSAIHDLNACLMMEPDDADVILSIAENYSTLNKFKTANNWISKAIRKKPGYGKPYIVRGEMVEAMVAHCQDKRGGKVELEDKIAYEEAQKIYRQAQKDVAYKAKSKTKIKNLNPFIRTKEDIFMNPNAKIKSACYSFLVGKIGKKQ
jgi:tetratricopeptide (TPR) repeat protein